MDAAHDLVARVRAAGCPETITVAASPNRRAWLGGRTGNPDLRSRTFHLEELLGALGGMTSLRLVRVGDGLAELHGLVIGSTLSKIGCSLVLGQHEARWCESDAWRLSHGYDASIPWRSSVVTLRYVDDICFFFGPLLREVPRPHRRLLVAGPFFDDVQWECPGVD